MKNRAAHTITRVLGTVLPGIFILGSPGCGSSSSSPTPLAQDAVTSFHSQLNAGQFEAIWNDADDLFRNKTSHEAYAKLTGSVHDKLGQVVSTTAMGWSVNYLDSQTRVVVHEQTQFQHGKAIESFMYIVRGKNAKLAGYNIQSDDVKL